MLALIEHPGFLLGDVAQVVDLGEQAANRDSRCFNEQSEGLILVVARLLCDAPVGLVAMQFLKAGQFIDRRKVRRLRLCDFR